ncbi:MAG: hypothetical protein R3D00_02295 [Bacteroidia bacterium]
MNTKSLVLLTLAVAMFIGAKAQQKVVPASSSALTGMTLPAGSKKDNRMISEIAAKVLLEMETKKVDASIQTVEVFILPPSLTSGFHLEKLMKQLSALGWNIAPAGSDEKYFWLQKGAKNIIAYFSFEQNTTDIYLGETDFAPEDISTNDAIKDDEKASNDNIITPPSAPTTNTAGYTFSTTNFDDGWTSVIKNDWVEVSKGNMQVYLLFPLPFDVSKFSGTGLRARDFYWDNHVTQYFTIQTKHYRDDNEVIASLQPDYVEGWAIDKQTGKKRFIAMRLSIVPNSAYLVIASAENESSLYKQFPAANDKYKSDLADMSRYNKFAVATRDIQGRWQNGNTSTAHWYYVTPGGYEGYAGMTLVASSATFNFNPGGNYTSIHNGASGSVGNMTTFQQEYKGAYTVTDWSVTATNRWQGKTDHFEAWFVAVRGGRVLWLKDGGMEYSLVKTK